jgi:hypothetical protein
MMAMVVMVTSEPMVMMMSKTVETRIVAVVGVGIVVVAPIVSVPDLATAKMSMPVISTTPRHLLDIADGLSGYGRSQSRHACGISRAFGHHACAR